MPSEGRTGASIDPSAVAASHCAASSAGLPVPSHPLRPMQLHAALAVALFASAAVAQITIPPHFSVYNGYSRGFNFTAQTSFVIISLDLPTDAKQTGDTASYLVRVNGATALWSIGNAGAIASSIVVNTGDVVDVIGNWSPAATSNFSAHNSYGSGAAGGGAAPYATLIEGVPHTLTRTGWQWDIGAPTWVSTGGTGAYLAPTTGQIGRVNVFTSSGGSGTVIATNTTLGAGCVASYASVYENFAAAAGFDLANTAITMLPTGSGYIVLPGTSAYIAPSATATTLTLGDDVSAPVALSAPFAYPGGTTTSLSVCSNGYVSVNPAGNGTAWTPDPNAFLNAANTGWWSWHDYNTTLAGSGQVKFEEVGNLACVTWDGVYSYGTASPDTFQMQFDTASGAVHLVWGAMGVAGNGYLVGYSPGGASANPGNTDLSATVPATIVLGSADILPLALAATSRPLTNANWNLTVSNVPATGVLGVDVFGLSDPGLNDLFFLGAPGCGLRAALDVTNAWLVSGATHTYSLSIPNNPALLNFNLFTTSAVFQVPQINALGAITSNGVQGKIGDL